jgi:hypothetical protein
MGRSSDVVEINSRSEDAKTVSILVLARDHVQKLNPFLPPLSSPFSFFLDHTSPRTLCTNFGTDGKYHDLRSDRSIPRDRYRCVPNEGSRAESPSLIAQFLPVLRTLKRTSYTDISGNNDHFAPFQLVKRPAIKDDAGSHSILAVRPNF